SQTWPLSLYDPKTDTWTTVSSLSVPRDAVVLEGPMYAVGGHDGWSYLNTVERWDPQARQWNYVASMSTPRSTMGVTALNGKCFYNPPSLSAKEHVSTTLYPSLLRNMFLQLCIPLC
uniref:Uncharacterized protein n=1 Tax=Hucho hucho TaxID=62062 RepID=A0A4W5K402_9TELE